MSETVQIKDVPQSRLESDYRRVREQTEALCQPLAVEDYGVQPMDDASPPKWHLAHTSWFFETFLLMGRSDRLDYKPYDPRFEFLFNSYYNSIGEQYPRSRRGHLSRPTVDEVLAYRAHVDAAMMERLASGSVDPDAVLLGLNHEQQHQELILTDVKYNFGTNPLWPAYRTDLEEPGPGQLMPLEFVDFAEAELLVGADPATGFCFDNELPPHPVMVRPFAIATRVVSNAEYLAFVDDGGYQRPDLWLSDGWTWVREAARAAPLYWQRRDDVWYEYTLAGGRPLDAAQPVVHVNFYEADAYARWAGARLPTEYEWERAANGAPLDGNFAGSDSAGGLHGPRAAAPAAGGIAQLFGDVWEWTASSYASYPGFKPLGGAFGEYNGKFMCNQMVLRGGSCATPEGHVRPSYRNFFYPRDQWQFSGIRLARDVG